MSNKLNISDITSVLVHIDGPMDESVYKTAKYSHDKYEQLLEKLYKNESMDDFSQTDKEITIDALRMFLEGISDGDVVSITGKGKDHYLNLYGYLLNEWHLQKPILKRQGYDTLEYQQKATRSGLVENL